MRVRSAVPGESVVVEFEPIEAAIFTDTLGLVGSLIDSARHIDHLPELIGDPALARLLPAGYDGDDDAADEFRRFTRDELIEGKLEDSFQVLSAFERAGAWPTVPEDGMVLVRIEDARVQSWLRAITDARLTLDARIRQDRTTLAASLDDDDIEHYRNVMEWLGFVQESLLVAVDPASADDLIR